VSATVTSDEHQVQRGWSELISARPRSAPVALVGEPSARLLSGPPAETGSEPLSEHLARLGPLPFATASSSTLERSWALDLVRQSGLLGRGGGEFPVARKLETAARAGGSPVVVVNGSEGEPASRKDRTLLELRPHLVLDGASFAAAAVGATEIVVYVEPQRLRSWHAVRHAIEVRQRARLPEPPIRLAAGAGRYVSGETSAVVSALEMRGGLPSRRPQPVAASGVGGRPTVVNNVETLAHLGLLSRFGAEWFRQAGSPGSPGSTLLTLAGGVGVPGLVVELLAPVGGGHLLAEVGGLEQAPPAVLVGGYAGKWIPGPPFCASQVDRGLFSASGVGLGCGVIATLPPRACGLATTLRLLAWLADESAGQCGPCMYGLPALAVELEAVVNGDVSRRGILRLHRRAISIVGQGACGHPDGAVALLESALDVFSTDAMNHVRGRPCRGSGELGWFPVPAEPLVLTP